MTALEVEVRRGQDLTSEDMERWSRLQHADPIFASPFLSWQFVVAVAAVRDDVRIGVMRRHGRTVGYFPFQVDDLGNGRPVAYRLADLHGVVVAAEESWRVVELLRGCGLRRFEFDHLLVDQTPWQAYQRIVHHSPYLELSAGLDSYAAGRRRAGSKIIKQTARFGRKLEREVGPLRFEPRVTDPGVLHRLIAWKSEQYRRTGLWDRFEDGWIVALLERLLGCESPELTGMLCTLHAGDRLAAVDFGLRSDLIWHDWFPAYNRQLSAYSPGTLLLLAMARHGAAAGVRRLELGRPRTPFKQRLMSGGGWVAEGAAEIQI